MKTRTFGVCVLSGLAGCVPIWFVVFTVILGAYNAERRTTAWTYFKKLEAPLADSGTHQLGTLQGKVQAFLNGFHELKVSSSHKSVLESAERISTEAKALREQMDSISGTDYEIGLLRLRAQVGILPRIGEKAFLENNPWFSGLLTYAWEQCILSLSIGSVLSIIVFYYLYQFAGECMRENRKDASNRADSASTGSGIGGGGGGYYGGGGYGDGGYYGGPPPGFFIHHHDGHSNQGFPPWGSM